MDRATLKHGEMVGLVQLLPRMACAMWQKAQRQGKEGGEPFTCRGVMVQPDDGFAVGRALLKK